jgi:hypothetical protein
MPNIIEDSLVSLVESALSGEKIPAIEVEELCAKLDLLKTQLKSKSLVTAADRKRWVLEDKKEIENYGFGGEGCDTCGSYMPGVIFPIATNENSSRAWVESCGSCETFKSDLSAALFLGRLLGLPVKMDWHTSGYTAGVYIASITFEMADAIMKQYEEEHDQLVSQLPMLGHRSVPAIKRIG